MTTPPRIEGPAEVRNPRLTPGAIILWLLFFTFAMILALIFGGLFHGLLGPWPNRF